MVSIEVPVRLASSSTRSSTLAWYEHLLP